VLLRLSEVKEGSYFIKKISKDDMEDSFKNELVNIGLVEGQIINVLSLSNKIDLYLEINESIYLLRRKTLREIYVKKN